MKKRTILLIIISIIIVLIGSIFLYKYIQIKTAKVEIKYIDNLNIEVYSSVKVSDIIKSINGKIINDYKIDTKSLGHKEIKFEYVNDDNIKIKQNVKINIIDSEAPLVWLGKSYNVVRGSEDNLLSKIMCGDNFDNKPNCEIIGEYDLNMVGSYELVFKATDSSENTTEKKFTLNVNEPKKETTSTNKSKTLFSDIVKNYKTDKTQIGIDISKWQGDVDIDIRYID